MKLIDIALKDLQRSFRSFFALAFMFGVPILVTAMFALMFGGGGEDAAFSLPAMQVMLVNQDAGGTPVSFGGMLVEALQAEGLNELFEITESEDVEAARRAVEDVRADGVIIIPEDFSAALLEPGRSSAIEFYYDPTLTLGPEIAKGILSQFVGGFGAAKGNTTSILAQLAAAGLEVDEKLAEEIGMKLGAAYQQVGNWQLVSVTATDGSAAVESPLAQMLGLIMGGMMVFYAFFTGANSAQTILEEEERGTLPRLLTTPTPVSAILGGKFLATLVTVLAQVVTLLVFSRLVFGIEWGQPLPLALAALCGVLAATSFGLFITSLMKDTKQSGIVFGGVMTIMGMLGIFSVFTQNAPGAATFTETLALIVPQGWAMRALQFSMDGEGLGNVLLICAGLLAWSSVFFVVAVLRLRKRFV